MIKLLRNKNYIVDWIIQQSGENYFFLFFFFLRYDKLKNYFKKAAILKVLVNFLLIFKLREKENHGNFNLYH